ncbi:hypothetical protein [Parasulfitobacter algicola]|uniref:Uncharacterized protein n=1 Tax=Parasulfitobacter algicola TaxID=2614809 RepID=A0ABX2ITE3_9RHOB|nr:hypothetical protein [Sulfitobacter algicola]NSX56187.1 hypothetical protein [Sulfitobacter algicola]
MGNIKGIIGLGVVALVGYFFIFGDKSEQSADLGQVLDRTEFVVVNYHNYLEKNNITGELPAENMTEFTEYFASILNADPRFYDQPLGLSMKEDASFLAFADKNVNNVQDDGEGDVFTVEIDSENNRLIATDVAGNSSDLRFSGTGFLAGALIGSMLSRQRAAGVTPGSFNDRKTTPRSSYKAPSSARSRARSGGVGTGK